MVRFISVNIVCSLRAVCIVYYRWLDGLQIWWYVYNLMYYYIMCRQARPCMLQRWMTFSQEIARETSTNIRITHHSRCCGVCVCGVNPCFQGICDFFSFSAFQFFSFKAGGASSPFSLAPTKTLDECWWYLTWSVRRTCHETISISEFCDSFTAATVLNLSFFKTCLSTTAFSRAKNHKSIWASWTDILSYKCVSYRAENILW